MKTILSLFIIASGLFTTACHAPPDHRFVSRGGGAVNEVPQMEHLSVVRVSLPDHIYGEATPEEKAIWQKEWPDSAAAWIAEEIDSETPGLTVHSLVDAPDYGYVLEVDITYLDVGDDEERVENLVDPSNDGASKVLATARIYNVKTNELVAEMDFNEGSAYDWDVPTEADIREIGEHIGEWLESRR